MIKFRRQNITELAEYYNTYYCFADILRQTAIKNCIDIANRDHTSLKELKQILFSNINILLDRMLEEKE